MHQYFFQASCTCTEMCTVCDIQQKQTCQVRKQKCVKLGLGIEAINNCQ